MRAAIGIDIADRFVLASGVGKGGGEDRAVFDVRPVLIELLIADYKGVAWLNIQHEIDVPAEDIRQSDRCLVMAAGGFNRLEE